MRTVAQAVKQQFDDEHQICRQAMMNTMVMNMLPSRQLDLLPLQTARVGNTRIPALILKDDIFIGIRQQVGLELPSEIDRHFNRPLLIYRAMWPFDKSDRPFAYVWWRDLWRLYRVQPVAIRGQVMSNLFRSIDLLPPKLKPKLDEQLFEMIELLI